MGPLAGVKIVEFAGIGPAPMAAMLLADMGATVLRIERAEPVELGLRRPLQFDLMRRSRETLALDLKSGAGVAMAFEIVASAHALIEGFRPGVMERLGLGPEPSLARNPKLVYGRMTGWGQEGPLAQAAGHDVNYIALTGALDAIGRAGQPPSIPLNLVGDFGGGALYLAMGILAALLETGRSGRGQVVDAAIVDGALSMMTMHFGTFAAGMWSPARGTNVTDTGAPFYNVYECADGKYVSIAPVEERFFVELLERMGIDATRVPDRLDRSTWAQTKDLLARRFRTRTRAEWCSVLEGTDSCFAPVLSMPEVAQHPHMAARCTLVDVQGVSHPAPAPRFGRTPSAEPRAPRTATRDEALASLQRWLGDAHYGQLERSGALVAVRGTSSDACDPPRPPRTE